MVAYGSLNSSVNPGFGVAMSEEEPFHDQSVLRSLPYIGSYPLLFLQQYTVPMTRRRRRIAPKTIRIICQVLSGSDEGDLFPLKNRNCQSKSTISTPQGIFREVLPLSSIPTVLASTVTVLFTVSLKHMTN